MTTRTITGTIRKPDGTAWASATVTFNLKTSFATATDAAVPYKVVTATTDANGDFSAALEVPATNAWRYQCILPDAAVFFFNLGAGSATTLHALIADANLSATVSPSDIATAISDKADKAVPAATNNIAVLDADGNLADGGSTIADISGAEDAYNTLSDGATTASVATSKKHKTANTGATSFTGFTGSSDGDRLFLLVADANTTLVHNASSFYLSGRQNVTPDSGTLLAFVSDGTIVREIGRRVFDLADTSDITWAVNGNDYEASLSNTGVSAASYTNASITVDAKGRVTAASSGAAFDNEVPLAIDLDTPNTTGSVVATFTADGSATADIVNVFRGATEVWALDSRGRVESSHSRSFSETGADINGWFYNRDNTLILDSNTGLGTGNVVFSQTATVRSSTVLSSNRPIIGFKYRAIIPATATNALGGTGNAGLKGMELATLHDHASLTQPRVRGLLVSAGQSRNGGTSSQVEVIEVQITSSGTVTNGTAIKILAPSTPAHVGTSYGLVIENQDIAIQTGAGDLSFGGIIDFTGTMGDSALDPTTDAPSDWVQVEIGGTVYYLPAYAAS